MKYKLVEVQLESKTFKKLYLFYVKNYKGIYFGQRIFN